MTFTTGITRPTHLWIFSFGRWYIFSTFYATATSCCQSCTLGFRRPNDCSKCILLIAIFNIYTSFVTWVCFNFTCYFGSFRFCLSDIRKFNILKMVQFRIILFQSVHRAMSRTLEGSRIVASKTGRCLVAPTVDGRMKVRAPSFYI